MDANDFKIAILELRNIGKCMTDTDNPIVEVVVNEGMYDVLCGEFHKDLGISKALMKHTGTFKLLGIRIKER